MALRQLSKFTIARTKNTCICGIRVVATSFDPNLKSICRYLSNDVRRKAVMSRSFIEIDYITKARINLGWGQTPKSKVLSLLLIVVDINVIKIR